MVIEIPYLDCRWGYHTLNAIIDFNTRMSEISIPIFIVHGGADEIVRVTGSQTLNDSITSQDKTLKVCLTLGRITEAWLPMLVISNVVALY